MSIFTFTVACGVTPTPTPTPRPTPVPWCCYEYTTFNEGFSSTTVYFENCDGTGGSKVVSTGYDSLPCIKQNSAYDYSGLVYYTEESQCYTVPTDCDTTTPTPTPTPTPTITPTPTSTPVPNYTVSIYAKRSGTPTCIIPPGSGTEPQFRIYYTFGYPMALQLVGGSIASNTCGFVGNITVPSGTTLHIGCRSWSYLSPIRFGVASGTSTCPDSGLTAYCGTFYDDGGYSQVITGNTSLAFTSDLISQFKLAPDGKSSIFDCYKFNYCGGTGGGSNT
jgi:hypothetical protein